MMQLPSGPRVIVVVPSGPLEDELDVLLVVSPLVTVDPPELEETEGPVVCVVVVLPSIVVDEDTPPEPAVTELESPELVSVRPLSSFSPMTMQV